VFGRESGDGNRERGRASGSLDQFGVERHEPLCLRAAGDVQRIREVEALLEKAKRSGDSHWILEQPKDD
jgi:hypothetical protein